MAPFYSNSSLLSPDLKLLSEKHMFNNMLTVGSLLSHVDVYIVHRYMLLIARKLNMQLGVYHVHPLLPSLFAYM